MPIKLYRRFQTHLHPANATGWPARLLRGSGWSAAGTVVTYAIKLLSSVLVARMLGGVNFGKFGTIQATVVMFNAFAGFGLGVTATKYIAELRSSDPERAGRIIGLTRVVTVVVAGACSLLVCAIAPWLARTVLAAPELVSCLRISTLSLFFGALNGAQIGVLSGFEAFKSIAQANFVGALVGAVVLVAGAYYGGLTGAVIGYAAGFAATWIVFYVALHQTTVTAGIRPAHATCLREASVLWQMGLPATLAGLICAPVLWACSAMLVRQNDGFQEMGVLSAANQWQTALLFLPSLIGGVAIPLIAERAGAADYHSAQRLVRRLFQGFVLGSLPLLVLLSVCSPWIMRSYRPEYAERWPVLIAVLLAAGLQACQAPVLKYLQATARMWAIFFMSVGQSAVLLVATQFLVRYGAFGLALASVLSFLMHSVWLGIYLKIVMRRDIARQSKTNNRPIHSFTNLVNDLTYSKGSD